MALLTLANLSGLAFRCTLSMVMVSLAGASVNGQSAGEYEVKAAFLFNFAKFVEWPVESPENNREPITICVIGQSPFGQSLNGAVNGKVISGRPIAVRLINAIHPGDGCQVLYIPAVERKRLPAILESLKGASVLTVGEGEGFASGGGMIGFRLDDGKVRFEINLLSAEQSRLRISSKLLNLAVNVRSTKLAGR